MNCSALFFEMEMIFFILGEIQAQDGRNMKFDNMCGTGFGQKHRIYSTIDKLLHWNSNMLYTFLLFLTHNRVMCVITSLRNTFWQDIF